MKALSIEAVDMGENRTGYMIGHTPTLKVLEGIEMLENALKIAYHALDVAAQSKGYGNHKFAPKDWKKSLSLGEVLSLTRQDLKPAEKQQ